MGSCEGGLRYRRNAPDFCAVRSGSLSWFYAGIATFATVLGDKNADCHTPPAVLVRGGSTMHHTPSVSRYSYGDTAIKGLSLR